MRSVSLSSRALADDRGGDQAAGGAGLAEFVIRAAARRASLPVVLVAGVVALVAALRALGRRLIERAVALGLYGVGSFLASSGLRSGSRSLFRSDRIRAGRGRRSSALWETHGAAAALLI